MDSYLHTRRGFTIIELILSLAIMVVLLTVSLYTFNLFFNTYDYLHLFTNSAENLRFFSTILERQINQCPAIYIVNNRIYLKDLETPEYYNYYTLKNGIIVKTKTNSQLLPIGLGETSQIAGDIEDFTLTYGEQGFYLYLSTEDKKYELSKEIRFFGKVVRIQEEGHE